MNLFSVHFELKFHWVIQLILYHPYRFVSAQLDHIESHMSEKCATTKKISIATFLKYEIRVAVAC